LKSFYDDEPILQFSFYSYFSLNSKGISSRFSPIFLPVKQSPSIQPNLKMEDIKSKFPDIVFVKTLLEMINIIHLGLLIEYIIIIEGSLGKDKHNALQFIESFGFEIISLSFSSFSSVEDFLCKFDFI
jgi:hypothetical protein